MGEVMTRRLYRSRKDRIIAGVAGGIADYLGIDPTIVRVLWVIALLIPMTAPVALLLYVALALLMPEAPA